MSAYIYTKNFFLVTKQFFLSVFCNIRNFYLIIFLFFLANKIKQWHLSRHRIFLLLNRIIKHTVCHKHHRTPLITKGIKCSRLNKILHCPFIKCIWHTINKILHWRESAITCSFIYNCIDCRSSKWLNSCHCKTYATIIYWEFHLGLVNIWWKNIDIHLLAGVYITCYLWCIINYWCHKCRHKFYWIICL